MKQILLSLSLSIFVFAATDFNSMSLEELRDQRQNITLENKDAYLDAVKKRKEELKAKAEAKNENKSEK